ncbi:MULTISPECIES: XRE family transcriptional regulator [Brevibacterium]|uniref:XRE family transcriptional regulator n=1 Tax=Brevibacterium TaxID=1696 RepID=UPI0021536B0A|nr:MULTISPECIES: XRE family transcriptional regulator [Brevibacterium]
MLRQARKDAVLTQSVLSRRAGFSQSFISAYERGNREPSVAALNLLLNMAGYSLAAIPEPETLRLVRSHSRELIKALARLSATNMSVFGSVARGDDRPDSDIDLLVDLDDSVGLFKLMRMRSRAEEILGCAVDMIPREGLKKEAAVTASRDEVSL